MKALRLVAVAFAVLLICAGPAAAQDKAAQDRSVVKAGNWGVAIGAGLGAGITILGAAYGISLIASRAVESMARQPEVAGNIQGAMIVSAALIEGATFFSLIVCILVLVLS